MLPAYAGMILDRWRRIARSRSAPRVCGDDPLHILTKSKNGLCSPRMRG